MYNYLGSFYCNCTTKHYKLFHPSYTNNTRWAKRDLLHQFSYYQWIKPKGYPLKSSVVNQCCISIPVVSPLTSSLNVVVWTIDFKKYIHLLLQLCVHEIQQKRFKLLHMQYLSSNLNQKIGGEFSGLMFHKTLPTPTREIRVK